MIKFFYKMKGKHAMDFLNQTEEEYTKQILKKISDIMEQRNLKQLDLSERSNIGQSTLSKILNCDMKLTLAHIIKICKALSITPSDLFSTDNDIQNFPESALFHIQENKGILNDKYINEEVLIRDIRHPVFKGYVNNEFYFYCYPTISTESALLEGKLTLFASEKNHCCLAKLSLYIGKVDSNNQKIYKEYDGECTISLSMGACYCILANFNNGEIITLNFNHIFISHQELICRVGAMVSTSSGGNRLPVMQRFLISKYELKVKDENKEDLDFVRGQLKLNESTIIIEKEKFNELQEIDNPTLQSYFRKCKNYHSEPNYYMIDESQIRDIDETSNVKAEAISLLRNASIAQKYNKISTKTDEFVFQHIDKISYNEAST